MSYQPPDGPPGPPTPPQGPPPPPPPGGQPPPYGQPPYGGQPGYPGIVPEHSKAMMILLFGIFGILCCGPLSIAAVVMGNTAKNEIAASNGAIGGEGKVQTGLILGWIGIALWAIGVIAWFGLGLAGS